MTNKLILTAITILSILSTITINGFEWCGIKKGLYIDVKTSFYKLYKPLERLTNNYIQVDINKDFEILTPEWVKINKMEVQYCEIATAKNPDIICD